MNTPVTSIVAVGIVATALALGGLALDSMPQVGAQSLATPTAVQDCLSFAKRRGLSLKATPQESSPMTMATPDADRQATVAASGGQVMPFDVTRTTHVFTDLPDGGCETVTADDPRDSHQIDLIRSHLQKEARKFGVGDFSDPVQIHGNDMPGVARLQAGFTNVLFTYEELPDGAAISYRSADPALVSAIHAWFAAQRSDHGSHQTMPVMPSASPIATAAT